MENIKVHKQQQTKIRELETEVEFKTELHSQLKPYGTETGSINCAEKSISDLLLYVWRVLLYTYIAMLTPMA